MRILLFPMLLLATLAACAGHAVRPPDETGPAAPAPTPPVAAPAPTTPPPKTGAPQPAEPYRGYTGGATLDIRRIGQWIHTGIEQPRRQVFQDANAWAQFWSELGVGDRPELDFTHELVIAVASGQQRSGGFSIAVERVTQQEGDLTIQVVETSPGPNCVTTSELTQPVEVVTVPLVKVRNSSFVERKVSSDCR
jgi:hypothetical protein